jgi:methylated-DNA-[protein]-cysteine S-methyltransferase
METAFFKTPLGTAKIVGDENGIVIISVQDEEESSTMIPEVLKECVMQLESYFEGKKMILVSNSIQRVLISNKK